MSPQSAFRRGVPKLIFSSLNDFPSKLSLVQNPTPARIKKEKKSKLECLASDGLPSSVTLG